MDFWTRLESLRESCNVLEHPFYERWSAGELSHSELAHYAGEYHHAVVALACASENCAGAVDSQTEPVLRAQLDQHAREETSHIALWEGFSRALGSVAAENPNPETVACASEWAGEPGRELLDSLVTLYTIESGQPEISATKHAGLLRHYGLSSTEATAYFRLHERLDVEHSSSARAMIEERLGDDEQERLLGRSERVLRANWLLLDGVERVAHAA